MKTDRLGSLGVNLIYKYLFYLALEILILSLLDFKVGV